MGRTSPRAKLRALMSGSHLIVAPGVWDPYTARVAESLGYESVTFGGYNFGAHLVTSEALVTLTEVATLCRYVTAAVEIPALGISPNPSRPSFAKERIVTQREASGDFHCSCVMVRHDPRFD